MLWSNIKRADSELDGQNLNTKIMLQSELLRGSSLLRQQCNPDQRVIHLDPLKAGRRGQVEQEEEEEVQTAAGFTPRGQRSWETAGQYEDERSMPRLDKPEPHVSGSKAVDKSDEESGG